MLIDARIYDVRCPSNRIIFDLADGRVVETPLAWFPILQAAPREDREGFEIDDDGRWVYWPCLGERISAEAILLTRFPAAA